MDETDIKSGVVPDIYDSRDYQWADIAAGAPAPNWEQGFDIESKLGHVLKAKSQNGSYSCGGQAFSYYGQVLQEMTNGDIGERSAKFLYSQCYIPNAGSRGRDLCDVAVKQGFGFENDCCSYENGNPPSEAFMTRSEDITVKARLSAKNDQALSYAVVNMDIDSFAQAIENNYGLCAAVSGQNGKGWMTAFPLPPDQRDWGHWLYFGKLKMINGKKHIGCINSLGKEVGYDGWQWISEDYFKALNCQAIYSAWTIVVRKNNDGLIRRILLEIIRRILGRQNK